MLLRKIKAGLLYLLKKLAQDTLFYNKNGTQQSSDSKYAIKDVLKSHELLVSIYMTLTSYLASVLHQKSN